MFTIKLLRMSSTVKLEPIKIRILGAGLYSYDTHWAKPENVS